MRYVPRTCFALILAIITATIARGQITAFWQRAPITPAAVADDPRLGEMQCWDLKVTTTGNWASAGLRAVLPAGNFFYKHPLGSNSNPNPFFFPAFPGLEFTSYIRPPFEWRGAPTILGGFPEGQPVSLGDAGAAVPGTMSFAWGDLSNDPPGTYHIARLTFPRDALANVINVNDVGPTGQFSNTSQVNPDSTTEIPDIPEPAAAGLAVAGALLAAYRRAGRGGVT